MRAREFIRELDITPIVNQETDRYGRQDTVGVDVSKKIGPGTASVQSMAMTSPDIDSTQINNNVSANYRLPLGNGDISAGVTRTPGLPNNQFNIQGSVPLAGGNFSAGVSHTKGQSNNFNLGFSRQVGPGQLNIGINKQDQGGPAQGQIRYNMPFEEEEAGVTKSKTVEFEGLTLKISKRGHELMIDALDDWGNKVLGHVKFNIGDGRELDPQDLRVDDRYQGQGIARVMYDYVKNLGYKIVRSPDQTDAGAGFWDKHRGEDVRVWESFDQPYPVEFEYSEYGDIDALTRLPDGTYLSIMFNQESGHDGRRPSHWSVEFYRNNSQEVTGEGDAQKVFATVLAAIQQFVIKMKPGSISFSASKEVDMDADDSGANFNPESRAKLYNRLVQRYAGAMGYSAQQQEGNGKVTYTLRKVKPAVAEEQLDELSFLGSECTKDCSGHRAGYDWSKRKGLRHANSPWSPSFNKGAALAVAGK